MFFKNADELSRVHEPHFTDFEISSSLFDLNYEFTNGSFAFSPG